MRHDESGIQKNCVTWFRLQYPEYARLLFAVPNGGARSRIEAAIMKGEGVTAGVADLLLLVPVYSQGETVWHGMAIEMKTATGRQSEAQRAWQKAIEGQGYRYALCRSFEEFRAAVCSYFRAGYP